MFHNFIFLLVVFSFVLLSTETTQELNKLNVVQVNMSNIVYKRLALTKYNILTATPLAILDLDLLKTYQCYKNIRTNFWTLGIPIIFWNEKYMKNISQSILQNNKLKTFKTSGPFILPPSGINAYRLNWRRFINDKTNSKVIIDSSWIDAKTDYVLPMWHVFFLEFLPGNNSKALCVETKSLLVNETFQSFELTVDFQRAVKQNFQIKNIEIKIKDIRSVKMFNDTGCQREPEKKCCVSKDYAEKWAYDVSEKVMERNEIYNLNLQTEMFDAIFNYLCKERISMDSVGVKRLKTLDSGEMACKIPRFVQLLNNCTDSDRRNFYWQPCANYSENLVRNFVIDKKYYENTEFSVPVTIF